MPPYSLRNPTTLLTRHVSSSSWSSAATALPPRTKAAPQWRALSGLLFSSRTLRTNLPTPHFVPTRPPRIFWLTPSMYWSSSLNRATQLSVSAPSLLLLLLLRSQSEQPPLCLSSSGHSSRVPAQQIIWSRPVDAPDNWVDEPYCWFDHCHLLWLLAVWVIISRCYCWLSLNRVKVIYKNKIHTPYIIFSVPHVVWYREYEEKRWKSYGKVTYFKYA